MGISRLFLGKHLKWKERNIAGNPEPEIWMTVILPIHSTFTNQYAHWSYLVDLFNHYKGGRPEGFYTIYSLVQGSLSFQREPVVSIPFRANNDWLFHGFFFSSRLAVSTFQFWYPLVNVYIHKYGKSPFLMGKSTN